MSEKNKTILFAANNCVAAGDNEGFLAYCTEDVIWEFKGDQTLKGKDAVRKYMQATYVEPPKFNVERAITGADNVVVLGKISLKNESGNYVEYDYCDVWYFKDEKITGLKAYVVEAKAN